MTTSTNHPPRQGAHAPATPATPARQRPLVERLRALENLLWAREARHYRRTGECLPAHVERAQDHRLFGHVAPALDRANGLEATTCSCGAWPGLT